MCMCMHSIPLLDAMHTHTLLSLCVYMCYPLVRQHTYTHRDAVCSVMCSVPLLDTTHTRGLLQLIYCVIHSIPLLDTVYNTIDVVCYRSSVCMCDIPLVDTTHTQCMSIAHYTRSLWYSIAQELHTLRSMYVCTASPYQMLYIHTYIAIGCKHWQRLCTQEASRTYDYVCMYSIPLLDAMHTHIVCCYVCCPLVRQHT